MESDSSLASSGFCWVGLGGLERGRVNTGLGTNMDLSELLLALHSGGQACPPLHTLLSPYCGPVVLGTLGCPPTRETAGGHLELGDATVPSRDGFRLDTWGIVF